MNLPNLISLSRLLAAPVMVWLILDGGFAGAFWLFVAAGITDVLDGFVAKRFNAETAFGKLLDPLADKVLITAVYLSLGHVGHLAGWLVIMVVFRDVLIVGGTVLYHTLSQSLTVQPSAISKVNTGLQIVLAAVVLADEGLGLDMRWSIDGLAYGVAVTTALSGALYVVAWSRRAVLMEDGR